MDIRHTVVEDASAEAEEVVDGSVNEGLIAGDGGGREDGRIARDYLDVLVVAVRHAGKGRGRLTLAAGRDDGDLFGAGRAKVVYVEGKLAREIEVAPLARHLDVVHHAAAGD